MLEARGLSYSINGKSILKDINVSLKVGELVVIAGPNGAGKSTLLRLLAGEIKADRGGVSFEGSPLSSIKRKNLAKRRAVLSQDSQMAFGMTGWETVFLGRTPHLGSAERSIDYLRTYEALRQAKAEAFRDRLLPSLSGGERQRVHFARSLNQISETSLGSRYLFLDEPTSSLDLVHQHQILESALALSREDCGVLVVLHDLNLAARYADRVILLRQGSVLAQGRPAEVFTEKLIRQAFRTEVLVRDHPCFDCPLIVTLRASREEEI